MKKADEQVEKRKSRLRKMIDAGAEIGGGAIGGALGLVTAGPGGAILLGAGGAAAGRTLRKVGEEISQRLLGPREEARVGRVMALAAVQIEEELAKGRALRDDGFFDTDPSGRSSGTEVVEGLLLKSQREAEERKLPFIANLLAGISFDPTISAARAHQLIKIAEQLTYRQLCLLGLAVQKNKFDLRDDDYRDTGTFAQPLLEVLYECTDLYQKSLVNFGGSVAFGPTDVKPASMNAQGLGGNLYNLMRLGTVQQDTLEELAKILS